MQDKAFVYRASRLARLARALVVPSLMLIASVAAAQEFRGIRPIQTPGDGGVQGGEVIEPLPREVVERAVRILLDSWNTSAFGDKLADQFYDGTRLTDAIGAVAPRDARLRLLSVQDFQTHSQNVERTGDGRRRVVSVVTARVRTQLEFNDPVQGFQRREGTNEYLMRITQTYR